MASMHSLMLTTIMLGFPEFQPVVHHGSRNGEKRGSSILPFLRRAMLMM